MRKALIVLGICILATPAWAGGGYSLFGSYAEVNDDGQTGGLGVRLTLGGTRWVGDLSFTWYPSVSNVDTIAGYRGKVQVMPAELGARYLFNPYNKFMPYVGGGVSLMYTSVDNASAKNGLGFYGLLGFNLGTHRTKFFAEAVYRWAESDVTYGTPASNVKGTMDVGGFGVNAGVIYTF